MKKSKQKVLYLLIVFVLLPLNVLAKVPNDPNYSQWAYVDTNVYDAWDYTTGSKNVVVAVIDNGFDINHPDLVNNVWENEDEIAGNSIDDDKNGYVDDVWGWNFVPKDENKNGEIDLKEEKGNNNPVPDFDNLTDMEKKEAVYNHGTVVAGLIGAVGNNNKDGVGINWQVKLMNLKAVGEDGVGDIENLEKAIYYAVNNGAQIINISMVSDTNGGLTKATQYAYDKGVVVVAAAGNDTGDLNLAPRYPVCADEGTNKQQVLGVSAINEGHHIAIFSNSGSNCIDLTAPGVNLNSTVVYSPKNGLNSSYSLGWKGTSFATPLVSGTVALIKSLQPEWGPDKIYETILNNTHHTQGQNEEVYATLFGAGLLQIDKAVKSAYEQINAVNSLQELLVYQPQSGKLFQNDFSTGSKNYLQKNILKNVTELAGYKQNNKKYFLSLKKEDGFSQIKIYDELWKRKQQWKFDYSGEWRMLVGDVNGDKQPEIIFYPTFGSRVIYKIYTLSGKKLVTKNSKKRHSGVSLSLVKNNGANQLTIAALLKIGNNTELLTYEEDKETNKISLDLKNSKLVSSGDLNGDKRMEYVVLSKNNSFNIYDQEGNLLKTVSIYDATYKGDIDLLVGDYNNDQKDEIIVIPLNGKREVKIFNESGQELAKIWPFGEKNSKKILLMKERN